MKQFSLRSTFIHEVFQKTKTKYTCVFVTLCLCNSVFVVHAFLCFFLMILSSSEIPLKIKRFKMLIEGAADLDNRKVFCRFLSMPTFALHIDTINLTCLSRDQSA